MEICEECGGVDEHLLIEIMGDGDNFECDVIGHKMCPKALEAEDFNPPNNPHLL